MPNRKYARARKEPAQPNSDAPELSDENLEDVAGGQTNCIPVDPITSDVLPLPELPPFKQQL